jgi:hypothetical protein
LVGHHPTNQLIGREPNPDRKTFHPHTMRQQVISGIRPGFPGLSQSQGQVTHVLLTRSPLEYPPKEAFPLDLHVLSTPPAFVLSQDQTLHQGTTTTPTPQPTGKRTKGRETFTENILANHRPAPKSGTVHCLKEIPTTTPTQGSWPRGVQPPRERQDHKGTGF